MGYSRATRTVGSPRASLAQVRPLSVVETKWTRVLMVFSTRMIPDCGALMANFQCWMHPWWQVGDSRR